MIRLVFEAWVVGAWSQVDGRARIHFAGFSRRPRRKGHPSKRQIVKNHNYRWQSHNHSMLLEGKLYQPNQGDIGGSRCSAAPRAGSAHSYTALF